MIRGNVYITGQSKGTNTGIDYATIKYNDIGIQQWVARYNGPGNGMDIVNAMVLDDSGNVYVTGECEVSDDNTDYAVIKYNRHGIEQWVARYNGPGTFEDVAEAIAVDNSGNVYITGSSMGAGWFAGLDYATVKYDRHGNQKWVARYGDGSLFNEAVAIAIDKQGYVYVTGTISLETSGYFWGSDFNTDFLIIKYDENGVQQWIKQYNGPSDSEDFAVDLEIDSENNIIVSGGSVGEGTKCDYVTIKYNSSGDQLWIARYNSPDDNHDDVFDIAVDDSDNVIVTGIVGGETLNSNSDYVTVKYNSAGEQKWVARYDGPAGKCDRVSALAVDHAGNIYVTGQSADENSKSDFATIKYNNKGVQQWIKLYTADENSDYAATAIVVDSLGNVYVTGTSAITFNESKYTTIKYIRVESEFNSLFTSDRKMISKKLSQNYPNPFNAATMIRYKVPQVDFVSLKIYNMLGQELDVLMNEKLAEGEYEVKWDATGVMSGVYFYRLQVGDYIESKKLIVLR